MIIKCNALSENLIENLIKSCYPTTIEKFNFGVIEKKLEINSKEDLNNVSITRPVFFSFADLSKLKEFIDLLSKKDFGFNYKQNKHITHEIIESKGFEFKEKFDESHFSNCLDPNFLLELHNYDYEILDRFFKRSRKLDKSEFQKKFYEFIKLTDSLNEDRMEDFSSLLGEKIKPLMKSDFIRIYSGSIVIPSFSLPLFLERDKLDEDVLFQRIRKIGWYYLKTKKPHDTILKMYKNLLTRNLSVSEKVDNTEFPWNTKFYNIYGLFTLPTSSLDDPLLISILDSYIENYDDLVERLSKYQDLYNRSLKVKTKLSKIEEDVKNMEKKPENNYKYDHEKIKEYLNRISIAYSYLTELEKEFGTERYFEDVFAPELRYIHSKAKEISKVVNCQIDDFKKEFLKTYSIDKIAEIVESTLNNEEHLFESYLPEDTDTVFLFIVDGLGYVQYLWSKNLVRDKLKTNNFFKFITDLDGAFDFTLSSVLTTNTQSGLFSIYTGDSLKKHGIPGKSFFENKGRKELYLNSPYKSFEQLTQSKSFISKLHNQGINIHLITNSTSENNSFMNFVLNERESIYSYRTERGLFKEINSVIEDLNPSEKNLVLIYHPYIDRRGHSQGPFTKFEINNFDKLNIFLFNLFKNIKENNPELFEKSVLFLTADHGFYEDRGNKIITDKDIKRSVEDFQIQTALNNRSCFIKNIKNTKKAKEKLKDYLMEEYDFDENDLFLKPTDEVELLGSKNSRNNKRCGDLFLSLKNEGLILPSHWKNDSSRFLGNHGGVSAEELFVPFVIMPLSITLKNKLEKLEVIT